MNETPTVLETAAALSIAVSTIKNDQETISSELYLDIARRIIKLCYQATREKTDLLEGERDREKQMRNILG